MFWQPGVHLDEIEKQAIEAALKFFQGNKTATAESLGISVRTLHTKCDQYKKDEEMRNASLRPKERGHLEPPAQVPEEQPMPMQKRKKV